MGQQSEISARYRSLFNNNNTQPIQSDLSRKLDSMDFVDFLFELVRATKGQSQFKNIILKGSLSQLKKTDELNNVIKNSLISLFGCDSTLLIRTEHTTKSSIGININKNEIDTYGLLGIDPNTSPGKYLYEGNDPTKHINYLIYKAQGVTENNPLIVNYKNRVLFNISSNSPNSFNFKFGEYYEHKNYGDWLNDYLTVSSPIFNTVNFTTILTDLITGSISLKGKKNKLEIQQQSSLIVALQKLFGFCTETQPDSGQPNSSGNNIINHQQNSVNNSLLSSPGGGSVNNINSTTSLNPFDFSFDELDFINRDADLKSRGKINFITCNNLELDINPNDIMDGLDSLFSSSNDDSVYSYDGSENHELPKTNQQNGSSYDNSLIEPNINNAANFFDTVLNKGAQSALNAGETNLVIDIANMNSELQLNILKAIPYALIQMVLTPKIMLVPKLHAVLSGDKTNKSTSDFVIQMAGAISNIGAKITTLLINNIFDAIKSDLIKLGKELATNFLKQRGIDYASTLLSLLKILDLFNTSSSSCGGVLSQLLKLLKLSNFGPMPTLPPPLILVGGVIKPGMNSVAIINDIKSNLTEKGIETSATLPDGTPNKMMIAMEETVKVMVMHLKTNSTIQTFGIGATGPVQGYGQLQ